MSEQASHYALELRAVRKSFGKAEIICGADLVAIDIPLLLALECRLCNECERVWRRTPIAGCKRRPGFIDSLFPEVRAALNLPLQKFDRDPRIQPDTQNIVTAHRHLAVVRPPQLEDADRIAGELRNIAGSKDLAEIARP